MSKKNKSQKPENTDPAGTLEDYLKFRQDITGKEIETLLWSALGFEPDAIIPELEKAKQEATSLFKKPTSVPPTEKKAGTDESFSDEATQQLTGDLVHCLRFRKIMLEGALAGNEPAFAALILLSLLTTLSVHEVAKQNSPVAKKWAGRFLVWPWFYAPNRGYQRKLEKKLQKLVGQNTMIGPKFSRNAEGELNLEAMLGMLWIMLLSSSYDEDSFRRNPELGILRHLRWGSPTGVATMKKVLAEFLEILHEQATLQDPKLAKPTPSERKRPMEHAAYHAAQMLLKKP